MAECGQSSGHTPHRIDFRIEIEGSFSIVDIVYDKVVRAIMEYSLLKQVELAFKVDVGSLQPRVPYRYQTSFVRVTPSIMGVYNNYAWK